MYKKLLFGILIAIIFLSGIFSLTVNAAIQMTSIINTGYYKIFKKNVLIGNVKDFEDIKTEVLKRYGAKVEDNFYFGKDVVVEYAAYEEVTALSKVEEIFDLLDIQVEGLRVETDTGKKFTVMSYRDWQNALGNIVQFIQSGETKANATNAVSGEIRVTENFTYKYERMPIDEAKSEKEIEKALIFSDVFDVKTDIVQNNDTIETIAERNNVSEEQIKYVNDINAEDLLVPGTALNVSEINYAVDFSYPIIENVVEDVAFEIEYQDDPDKYTDEEEIIQAGVNGLANAQYLSYVINGETVPGERLQYEIIKAPVKQIIKRGTKQRITLSTSTGSDAPYANIAGFIWPARGICISAEFMDPNYGGAHYAIDIAGSHAEDIWVAAAGTVESAEFSGAWGNQVLVNHHNGLKTRYAHLSGIGVNKGEELQQGKYVGAMGNTGLSYGVHLHFEVHANGTRVNPRPYLPNSNLKPC